MTSPAISESVETNSEDVTDVTDVQEEETEEDVIQHLLSSSTKEELATQLVLLQGEYKKQDIIIKRYREQTKLLLDQKTALAKSLRDDRDCRATGATPSGYYQSYECTAQ